MKELIDQTYSTGAYSDNPIQLSRDTLTLGCEFEFVLAHSQSNKASPSDPLPSKRSAFTNLGVARVRKVLSTHAKLKCASVHCAKEYPLPVEASDGGDWSSYTSWQVGEDATCVESDRFKKTEDFDFYGLEVRSRIILFDESIRQNETIGTDYKHWTPYDEEVTCVLQILNEQFGLLRNKSSESGYYALLPDTCGLHVHIGNGAGVPIPFETTKKVFAATLAAERQIDGFHAAHRLMGTSVATELPKTRILKLGDDFEGSKQAFNKPLSYHFLTMALIRQQWKDHPQGMPRTENESSALRHYMSMYPQQPYKSKKLKMPKEFYGYDIRSWLWLIQQANDIRHLRDLSEITDQACVLRVENQPCRKDNSDFGWVHTPKLTLEFRQASATFLPEAALSFVDSSAKMVLFCHDMAFPELCAELTNIELTSIGLCKRIGCLTSTVKFYDDQLRANKKAATKQLDLEEAHIKDDKSNRSFPELASVIINEQHENIKGSSIEKKIRQKLLAGGYGQFNKDELRHLETIFPKDTDRQQLARLVIGYSPSDKGNEPVTTSGSSKKASQGSSVSVASSSEDFGHSKGESSGRSHKDMKLVLRSKPKTSKSSGTRHFQ